MKVFTILTIFALCSSCGFIFTNNVGAQHSQILSIINDNDDGEVELSTSIFRPQGEPGNTNYIGEWGGGGTGGFFTWSFFRFKLTESIPAGSLIQSSTKLLLYGFDFWTFNPAQIIRVVAERSCNSSAPSAINHWPGGGVRAATTTVLWQTSTPLVWNIGVTNRSESLAPILQELVNLCGGLNANDYILIWATASFILSTDGEVGTSDYSKGDGNSARIQIDWIK